MKFRDYYDLPPHLTSVPDGTLERIEQAAVDGVVTFYFNTPRKFWNAKAKQHQWMTVWQLLDYNIDTNSIIKLYPYRKGKNKVMPEPDTDKPYFTPESIPPSALKMLRDKAYYYKVGAKRQ